MKFKVGDKVKVLKDPCWHCKGRVGIVKEYRSEHKHWCITIDEAVWPYYEYELELVRKPGKQLEFEFMYS